MKIRESKDSDLSDIVHIHKQAFGEGEGPAIADLVIRLMKDPSASPYVSLLTIDNGRAIGHVLFTKARITDSADLISAAILAPLAVIPEAQRQGVGGKLIAEGLRVLSDSGVELVFVLGHPDYYPRHGFKPAGILGFDAPYPIPEKHANAWMVRELRLGISESIAGTVLCADALNRPEYWRE